MSIILQGLHQLRHLSRGHILFFCLFFLFIVHYQNSTHLKSELDKLISTNHHHVEQRQITEFQSASVLDESSLAFFQRIQRHKYNLDCRSVVEWNETELNSAKRLLYQLKSEVSNQQVPVLPNSNFEFPNSKCDYFKKIRGYNTRPVSEFELNFPIAFSILTYNQAEQFERLLRAIYRPHNIYCVQLVTI